MEYCHNEYDSQFLWLTDDNFSLRERGRELSDEIIRRGIADDIMWFAQARGDDIINHRELLPRIRKSGNHWMLVGLESNNPTTLNTYRKDLDPSEAKSAIELLKKNDIFAQATFIIGERKDSRESIKELRLRYFDGSEWVDSWDSDQLVDPVGERERDEDEEQWEEHWDSYWFLEEEKIGLPPAVEVTFVLSDDSQLMTVTDIPSSALNETPYQAALESPERRR